jgi:AmmeMemoRadiSam system protein B
MLARAEHGTELLKRIDMSAPQEPSATEPPLQPRLRRVESFPLSQPNGETVFALRDPEGFAGSIVLPYHAAVLASFMDGSRTQADIQQAFEQRFGQKVSLADLEHLTRELDERYFLDTGRFRARWKAEIETYLNSPLRAAAHAGLAYAADATGLGEQISALFTAPGGPGPIAEPGKTAGGDERSSPASARLCGMISPHIDFRRGAAALAWGYKKIAEESDADLFVIFGTAHGPMRNLFALTKKDFDTPLGAVETDRKLVASLAWRYAASAGMSDVNLFADELAHRQEHSLEFQAVLLRYALAGRRPFKILPILVGSFHEFVEQKVAPSTSPPVAAMISAVRAVVAEHAGRVLWISSADLAHIGQRYGDRDFLNAARLQAQGEADRQLMADACSADADAFFRFIAHRQDQDRVCGLSPTYMMLEAARPVRGELLRYDQAVELDGTSCVSFASAAFYDS